MHAPHSQCTNGHIICAACLLAHTESDRGEASRICPTCRDEFGQKPIRNLLAETLIGDCSGQCDGCGVSMLRKVLVGHRQHCDEVTVECPLKFAGCNARPRQNDLEAHMLTNQAGHVALLAIAQVSAAALPRLVALLSETATEPVNVAAANALRDLADDGNHVFGLAIARAGAIPLLEKLLHADGTGTQIGLQNGQADTRTVAALGALRSLALYNSNFSDTTIIKLIDLLDEGSDETKEAAVMVLCTLSTCGYFTQRMHDAINPLVALLHEGTYRATEAAIILLNNLCFGNSGFQVAVARAGAIAPLVEMMSGDGTDQLKEEATCALRNLAGDAHNKVIIARAGAIAPLVALLSGRATDGCNLAAAAVLGELAKNTDIRVDIIRAGAVPLLIALWHESGTDVVNHALERLGVDTLNEVVIAQACGPLTRSQSKRVNQGRAR